VCWLNCTDAQLIERLHDRGPPDRIGEEQYEASATRARHLPSERTCPLGDVKALFDARVRNPLRQLLLRLPSSIEDLAQLHEVSLEERLLHGDRFVLEFVGRLELRRSPRGNVAGLALDDVGGIARNARVEQDDRSLQFVQRRVLDSQRIDDDPSGGPELHDVETAECRGVLVLTAARLAVVIALDLVGEARDVVLAERKGEVLAKCLDRRYDQGGRRAEARPRRGVRDRGQANPWPTEIEIAIHALVNSSVEMQGSRFGLDLWKLGNRIDGANIGRAEFDGAIHALFKGGVAIPVNRGVKDEATVGVAIRRHICSTSSEAKAQRRARTDPTARSLLGAIAKLTTSRRPIVGRHRVCRHLFPLGCRPSPSRPARVSMVAPANTIHNSRPRR
jgi:hypothetical protein